VTLLGRIFKMKLVRQENTDAVREFNCVANFGLRPGEKNTIKLRLTGAKTDEEAREAFEDYLKRKNPAGFPKMDITITETTEEEKAA
jgi:hypothetical protein